MVYKETLRTTLQCLLIAFAFSTVSFAANRYVRAGAAGSGNGSDWTNAYAALPSTLTRGDVYYIADGTYSGYSFKTPVSGTTPITIKKATTVDHGTDIGWSNTYGDGQAQFGILSFSTSYYFFDGVTGGGPGNWETGFGFKVQGSYHVIDFPAVVSEITIRHTDIQGAGRSETSETDLLYLVKKFTNITISYCFLHDVSRTMILTWPANGNGFILEYSKLARNGNAEHREAWSAGTDSNVTVRNNLFEDILGTGVIAIVNNNGDATNWNIYGNVFYHTGRYTDGIINTGVIMNRYDGPGGTISVRAVNWTIVNNVFAGIVGFTSAIVTEGPSVNYVVKNNIWFNNHTDAIGTSGATSSDYNWFYNNTRQNSSTKIDSSGRSGTNDVIGTSNPFVNWQGGDWGLAYAIAGQTLASQFGTDALGVIRGLDGTWDRGAYELGGATPRPTPPTNLSAIVQ